MPEEKRSGVAFARAVSGLPDSKLPAAQKLLDAKADEGHIGGLLAAPSDGPFKSIRSVLAILAEFFGTFIFAFAASTTPAGVSLRQQMAGTRAVDNFGPWGNGITLIIVVFLTANVSGGHVNPAVTLATLVTGHIGILQGLCYIVAQISGAIFGLLLVAGLVPGAYIGMGNSGPGCFKNGPGVTRGMIFGWEAVMTWTLVSVVYAVAIGKPSFGNVAPIAVGLTLFALNFAGDSFTGTAVNPARAIGPAAVFHCYWNVIWVYIIAEFAGGVVAGLMAGPLYGVRAPWLKKRMPAWLNYGMGRGQAATGAVKKKGGQPDLQSHDHMGAAMRDLESGDAAHAPVEAEHAGPGVDGVGAMHKTP